MREEGVCSHCETGPRSLGKRACRTAPRYAQSRFTASWTHCNLATGLRGFSPLVFSGEFHTPRLPRGYRRPCRSHLVFSGEFHTPRLPRGYRRPCRSQVVHRNAHPRPLGIHFHILWYRPKYTFLSRWVCMRADLDGKLWPRHGESGGYASTPGVSHNADRATNKGCRAGAGGKRAHIAFLGRLHRRN